MASNYPDSFDSLDDPAATDPLSNPAHAALHVSENDAIEAVQATLGLNPEGSYATVAERMSEVDTAAAAAQAAQVAAELAQAAAEGASTDAGDAANLAEDWAVQLVDPVSGGEYSAKYHAQAAASSATAAASSATSAASSAATVDATATTAAELRQFAADGSVLSNLPARVHPAEQLLRQAVWWIDASEASAGEQTVRNLGWGGSALDAQLGSSGSADSNDPKYLDWQGENYVYLPGVPGNYLSVPDEAGLDITGDLEIVCRIAFDDWTPASNQNIINKYDTVTTVSYYLRLNTAGTLSLLASPDGTSGATGIATSSAATGVTDGSAKWIKATFAAATSTVKFYLADDSPTVPTSWTQLGTDRTMTGVTSIYASTSTLKIGTDLNSSNAMLIGKVHRAIIKNGINGTPVLDVDCSQITSGADTSFTALTGQTVTINRSTSGRKTVGVVHPRLDFGTDDYMRVNNSPLWATVNAGEAVTVVVVGRQWETSAATGYWIGSRNGTNAEGYGIVINSTTPSLYVDEGANLYTPAGPSITYGGLSVLAGVIDLREPQSAYLYTNAVSGTPQTLSNSDVVSDGYLAVGSAGGFSYQDFEFVAAAVFRRALTAGEIATLTSYFQGREGA